MDYRGHAHHELRARRIAEAIAEQSAPVDRIRAVQRARRVAGWVGIAGAASLPFAALAAWLFARESEPTQVLSLVLIATLVLVPVSYVLARRKKARIRVDTEEAADLRLARFRGDVAATRAGQLASNAPPLVAAALLSPLGLQALIGIPLVGLRGYGAWIGGSGAMTVFGHLLLAFCGWRAVKCWIGPQDVPLRSAPDPWWELTWATLAAAAPTCLFGLWTGELIITFAATIAVALVTFLTGGLFWPYVHRRACTEVHADAAALRDVEEALDRIDLAVRIEDVEGGYAEEDVAAAAPRRPAAR